MKAELNTLRLDKIFYNLDPYPVGFREVQLGDDLSKVKKVYEKATIDEDASDRIYLPIEHNLFSQIGFFTLNGKNKIEMIIFFFKDPGRLSYETLKRKIGETFPRKEYTETISKSNKARLVVKGFFERIRVEVNEIGMQIDHE